MEKNLTVDNESQWIKNTLIGHKASISCLEIKSADQNTLLSGSEDCTIRLWDLKSNKVQKCIMGCFETEITSIKSSKRSEFLLFASSENSIYSFDLRFSGVLCKVPLSYLSNSLFDSINAIALNTKEDFISVADDSGAIIIIPVRNGVFSSPNNIHGNDTVFINKQQYKKLSRVHSNLVSSINYKSKNPTELLSGGFDCVCCIWDVSGGRPKSSFNFNATTTNNNSKQIFNPPFVQYCDYFLDDKFVLCGLGDGSLRLLNSKDLSPFCSSEIHSGMVTAVDTFNNIIVSGGIDCKINLSRVSDIICNDDTKTSENINNSTKLSNNNNENNKNLSFNLINTINHFEKVNCIKINTPITKKEEDIQYDFIKDISHLIISDISNNLTLYYPKN